MTDEHFFHAALDAASADAGARLLLAEWLAERGDGRARGYRWLARHRKRPYDANTTWDWWTADSNNPDYIRLPDPVWTALPPLPPGNYPRCKEFPSRREAEDAAARVIDMLAGGR